MANQKTNKIEQWFGKILYSLLVAYHHEDYVSEENGKMVITPANIWHEQALNNGR